MSGERIFLESTPKEEREVVIGYYLDMGGELSSADPAQGDLHAAMQARCQATRRRRAADLSGEALHRLLHPVFRKAWSAETADPQVGWCPQTKWMAGQEIPSVLVVQKLLGGELLAAQVGQCFSLWNGFQGRKQFSVMRAGYPCDYVKEHGGKEGWIRVMDPKNLIAKYPWARSAHDILHRRVKEGLFLRAALLYREQLSSEGSLLA